MRDDVVVAVHVTGHPERFAASLRSLRRGVPGARILVGAARQQSLDVLASLADEAVLAEVVGDTVAHATAQTPIPHVLVVVDPVLVPEDVLGAALPMLAERRIGTVSFLSNAAGFLSFPVRNSPRGHQLLGQDTDGLNASLRAGAEPEPVPIPFATGAAVLVSRWLMSALGRLVDPAPFRLEAAIAELSLRGRRRGFLDVLDATTYVTRLEDDDVHGPEWAIDEGASAWLAERFPWLPAVLEEELRVDRNPLGIALLRARTRARGMRVLIDGSCLGPLELGTQVQTLALVGALAERDEVAYIGVGIPGQLPDYAREVLNRPKVDARWAPDGSFTAFDHVDVLHRPFQPDGGIDFVAWRHHADRIVITIQDLIAYQVGAYHRSDVAWLQYRLAMQHATRSADGIVVISRDTERQVQLEQLPVPPHRMHLAANGTDHLTGSEPERTPRVLHELNRLGDDLVLVLGADYAHKNRDRAVEAFGELRAQGRKLTLLLVGASVPRGSSRPSEALALAGVAEDVAADVIALPDVDTEERNWLMRHARVLLYPSSAEGFGLVPFEAAHFGTPAVVVPAGAIAEVLPDLPVVSQDWSGAELAAGVGRLLDDPDLAAAQVNAVIAAGAGYTWQRTAGILVEAYRGALAAPPRD